APRHELVGGTMPVTSSHPGVVRRLSVWFIVRRMTVVPLVASSPLLKFTRTAATVDAGSTMSVTAELPFSEYRSGLANPRSDLPAASRAWLASAKMPAMIGEERLVPPMRYSE